MKDFLNPKSMVAPGALGSTTTMITGTLATQFGLPGHLTALAVSFLLGLVVFSDKRIPVLQRILYYVINSLIIFTMALGINSAGVAATKSSHQDQVQTRDVQESKPEPFFHDWF